MKTKNNWAILPYNVSKKSDFYLISTLLGSWAILRDDEFRRFQRFQIEENSGLFNRLKDSGIVVAQDNFKKVLEDYRQLNGNLFTDVSLFIIVVTTKCNLKCSYCQSKAGPGQDMSLEVAAKTLDIILSTRNRSGTLEFQGGEPLLNWPVIEYLIKNSKKLSKGNKDLHVSLVTNGLLLTKEKIDFLKKHKASICVSLDGPRKVHDKSRILNEKKAIGSYNLTVKALKLLKRNNYKLFDLLPTITRYSFPYYREIIDEYVKWGENTIALRYMNKLGMAHAGWNRLGYTPDEFNNFWSRSMDYILYLNSKGIDIKERIAYVILQKVLNKKDPFYVDISSPCGGGRSTLAFTPSGDVYPCDEARMLGEDIFKLGNVMENTYPQLMSSPNTFYTCQASLLDIWDYASAYKNWSGTCPVLNYCYQRSPVTKICLTPLYKVLNFQFDYIFEKIANDKKALAIFKKWVYT